MSDHFPDAPKPSFKAGDRVVVKLGPPEAHCRTPSYLRGTSGEVVELVGHYHNPSLLAFHKPGLPKVWLYRVRFKQTSIWDQYKGSERDCVMADLYEHWLTPSKEQ